MENIQSQLQDLSVNDDASSSHSTGKSIHYQDFDIEEDGLIAKSAALHKKRCQEMRNGDENLRSDPRLPRTINAVKTRDEVSDTASNASLSIPESYRIALLNRSKKRNVKQNDPKMIPTGYPLNDLDSIRESDKESGAAKRESKKMNSKRDESEQVNLSGHAQNRTKSNSTRTTEKSNQVSAPKMHMMAQDEQW